jgi:hypothetical protein
MKVESVRLAIEPRSVGACIDLACLFYRVYSLKVLGLTFVFLAPVMLMVYWLTATTDFGWFWAGMAFFFLTPFLGAAVVAGAGHWAFGDPFTIPRSLAALWKRFWSLLYLLVLTRLALALTGAMCWGLPFLPLATRYGFIPEIVILEQLRGRRIEKRVGEIMMHTFLPAMGRYAVIGLFAAAVWVSVFTLIDLGSGVLLGIPIFFGRLSSLFAEEMFYLMFFDPLVVSVLSATAWLVYPLARLAWFFCYLDARIRKEGWDVELAFRIEAGRLQTVP